MRFKQDEIERKYMQEPIEELSEDIIAINYSCHMHPITQLTIPDFMDQDKSSVIDTTCTILYAMLPMALNFLLNMGSGLTNILIIGDLNDRELFSQICLGNVIASILVYHLIEYLGAGFAIICSYFPEKEEVGFLYQKTLGLSFLICVLMTPVIYLSDRFFKLTQFNSHLAQNACLYAWALVPSYYLYSFLDTNKNYLQSQGVIFPPIIIHLSAVAIHVAICLFYQAYSEMTLLKVAWIKNFTDSLCCLALYFYIVFMEPTKDSWVEWSIKSTNNIGRFIQQVAFHQASTCMEIISFQILSIVACHLSYREIAAHFSFSLVYLLIYFFFVSLSQCVNKAIAISIEENEIRICKKKISLGFLLAFLLAFVIIINIVQHRAHFTQMFISDPAVSAQKTEVIGIFCLIIFIEGLNIITMGVVKTFQLLEDKKFSFIVNYLIGIFCSVVFTYYYNMGLKGIWSGWLVSIGISFLVNLKHILCLDFEETFNRMRDRYKMIKHQIRVSKYELAEQS